MPNNNTEEKPTFLIPVEWAVCSVVRVIGANSLEEALKLVQDHIDDIPLATDPAYIDGSYQPSSTDIEEIKAVQDYTDDGVEMDATNRQAIVYTAH